MPQPDARALLDGSDALLRLARAGHFEFTPRDLRRLARYYSPLEIGLVGAEIEDAVRRILPEPERGAKLALVEQAIERHLAALEREG